MTKSQSIENIAKALSAFQQEVEQPEKDKENPFFKSKYVPLPNVIAAVKKFGPKNGLSFMQFPVNSEKGVGVQTIVMHTSGEFIEGDPFFLPLDKQTPQAGGSCITYARRYSLSAAFGLDSETDDDGNTASETSYKTSTNTAKSPVTASKPKTSTETPEQVFEVAKTTILNEQDVDRLLSIRDYVDEHPTLTESMKLMLSDEINLKIRGIPF